MDLYLDLLHVLEISVRGDGWSKSLRGETIIDSLYASVPFSILAKSWGAIHLVIELKFHKCKNFTAVMYSRLFVILCFPDCLPGKLVKKSFPRLFYLSHKRP